MVKQEPHSVVDCARSTHVGSTVAVGGMAWERRCIRSLRDDLFDLTTTNLQALGICITPIEPIYLSFHYECSSYSRRERITTERHMKMKHMEV